MKGNKINKFLLLTSILSMIIILVGVTFSYFTITARGKADAISVEAGKAKLGLGVSQKFTPKKLIPTADDDIMVAYKQECTDDNGFGSCLAFELELTNFTDKQDITGTINFNVSNIEDLSYIVLNEDGSTYLEKTKVESGKSQSLGNNFTLNSGSSLLPSSKKFILVVWLTNKNEAQESYDATGKFSATVTFETTTGREVTGTIKGISQSTDKTSVLDEG